MKTLIRKVLHVFFPKYDGYRKIVLLRTLKRWVVPDVENKYLFILSPPYCGSTLLSELLSTSPHVSTNNPYGTREGQTLPSVKEMMFSHNRRWDKTLDFDWAYIKKEWRIHWDTSKTILLEKSPPNIIRVASIKRTFPNAYFLIFYRNPYAHCEGLIRRDNISAKAAAEFALACLEYQRENKRLPLKSMSFSYEELTTHTAQVVEKLITFLPELERLTPDLEFTAHNFKNKVMRINNLNTEKISKLSQAQLDEINDVFAEKKELLAFFNYEMIGSVSGVIES